MPVYRTCSGISRRELLAGFGALAAAIRGGAEVTSSNAPVRNSADACIFVNLNGAPSHVDTFDFKSGAWTPRDFDVRQSGKIALSRALFPKLSGLLGDLCIVRSIESWEAAHERGQFYLQTGHSSNPAFNSETPHIGSIVAYERAGGGNFPAFLALNGPSGQGAQFLGGAVEPVAPASDPNGFRTLEHDYFGNDSQERFEQKYKLLQAMDSAVRTAPYDPALADYASYYDTARKMMYDAAISNVFRMTDDERGRFGDTGFGRSCIVARNAVRARNGVKFINIFHDGWDTHQSMFDRGYPYNLYALANEVDRGVGSLVEDLKSAGDLARTLIVIMGEFGRTPGALNGRGGRDHHKKCLSAVLIGGGARGGAVIGETDKIGNEIVTPGWKENRPVYFEDVAATIYSALGIDWTKKVSYTPSGRVFEYVNGASTGRYTAVTEVFG